MAWGIKERYEALARKLDEHAIRLFAGSEALALGYGGIAEVRRETGLSGEMIAAGIAEIEGRVEGPEAGRIRRAGGGRKPTEEKDPTLKEDLERLIEPTTRGDPQSPLQWTTKSVRKLRDALVEQGHEISHQKVSELLHGMGYRLQSNRKKEEGGNHPDRDEQFKHIAGKSARCIAKGVPVISVDTKKKELIGDYKNAGKEWQPGKTPETVKVYDFKGELGKANPYGVYDVGSNEGWVNVGITHDTAEFAVESIRKWWYRMGKERYPDTKELYITADGGGSNGSRTRLWKIELQKLARELGIAISVSHFPPGTSKWNKIEHRLFAPISINWRGKPLRTYEIIVSLIAATTTSTGLTVQCELDTREYETKKMVSDEEMAALPLSRDAFHGEWNYTISPML